MTALKKNTSKPTLEALEDRFLPSANPLTMLSQPILNTNSVEAAVGRILQGVQQLNAFQTIQMVNYQNNLNPFPASVHLQSPAVPLKDGYLRIGAILYNPAYTPAGVIAVRYYRWQDPQHYNAGKPWTQATKEQLRFNPEGSSKPGWSQDQISVQPSFFAGQQGKQVMLEVKVAFYKNGILIEETKAGQAIYDLRFSFLPSQTPNNSSTTSTTQTQGQNVGNNQVALAQMSLRDRFFAALASKVHPDDLPIITSGDWGV